MIWTGIALYFFYTTKKVFHLLTIIFHLNYDMYTLLIMICIYKLYMIYIINTIHGYVNVWYRHDFELVYERHHILLN